ncbi:MAG: hypothetical protein QM758_08465, partial [Armatimonas sp.]
VSYSLQCPVPLARAGRQRARRRARSRSIRVYDACLLARRWPRVRSDVNVMGVAHGPDKELVLANKAAIDAHLESVGIPVLYTNVFWGGRSEIKPSEIAPQAYIEWCKQCWD